MTGGGSRPSWNRKFGQPTRSLEEFRPIVRPQHPRDWRITYPPHGFGVRGSAPAGGGPGVGFQTSLLAVAEASQTPVRRPHPHVELRDPNEPFSLEPQRLRPLSSPGNETVNRALGFSSAPVKKSLACLIPRCFLLYSTGCGLEPAIAGRGLTRPGPAMPSLGPS